MYRFEIENLLKNAKVCDDLGKREEYLAKYQRKSGKTKIILIVTLIVASILYMLMRKSLSFRDSMPFLIAEIVIATFIVGATMYINKRLKNKITKIISTNAPLLYIESKIYDVFTKRDSNPFPKSADIRSMNILWYYMRLKNDVKIKITESQYEQIKDKKFNKAKIYFFEDILMEYNCDPNVFNIELF